MPALEDLPIELLQQIGHELPDKDLVHFRSLCRATHNALDQDGQSFWRARYLTRFELQAARPNKDLGVFYRLAMGILKKSKPCILGGRDMSAGATYVQLLRHIILAASPNDEYLRRPISKNLRYIKEFELKSEFIGNIFNPIHKKKEFPDKISRLDNDALMITLGPWIFDFFRYDGTYQWDRSQVEAYASPKTRPIIMGRKNDTVNVTWVLHVLNFFRHHLCCTSDQTLRHTFEDFAWFERPQMWRQKLGQENLISSLGRTWRGTYSYLETSEIPQIRGQIPAPENTSFIDKNVDLGARAFQNMKIDIIKDESTAKAWPDLFEHILQPNKIAPITNAQPTHQASGTALSNKIRFEGKGFDDEIFFVNGYINPLPPQRGIPGWGRIVMMKYFNDDNGSMDINGLWAYEGIICPGGQMIVGRWWAPTIGVHPSRLYTGPFIFWSTDLGFTLEERDIDSLKGLDPDLPTQAVKMQGHLNPRLYEIANDDVYTHWDTLESVLEPDQCCDGISEPGTMESYYCFCGTLKRSNGDPLPCAVHETEDRLLSQLAKYGEAIADARQEEVKARRAVNDKQ